MTTAQIIFTAFTLAAFGFFAYTAMKIWGLFKLTKPLERMDKIGQRISTTILVAFGQQKMFKRPVAGLLHALVWWGFLVITVGTVEMIIDGIAGSERILGFLGPVYGVITASGELFAGIIILACIIFLVRRYMVKPKRFIAPEMKPSSKMDATLILFMILVLMASLLGLNMGYVLSQGAVGSYPLSHMLIDSAGLSGGDWHTFEAVNWWIHICLVLVFLNILPYSKHFHVIMAVPNVFFARLEPKAKLDNMASVTKEVKLMMDPETAFAPPAEGEAPPERFGIKTTDDITWKHLLDAYTCTECGRCTAVCPANNTGKKLSPRKLFIDLRAAATKGERVEGGKPLSAPDRITEEELWACTTCMACMEECPVNIDHVPLIIDMRRSFVMEDSKAPNELTMMFNNIENNGAPWQFSASDRMKWAEDLEVRMINRS